MTVPNPPVTLIAGAHCPSCGGLTLGVRASRIVCLGGGCAEPDATHAMLAADSTLHEHILTFDQQGVAVRHPLLERVRGDDSNCSLSATLACLRRPLGIGRFRVAGDDLHDIAPLTDADVLDPEYIGSIDKALAFHPLDEFIVGTVLDRRAYVPPGEPLREGWIAADGEGTLDPAEYPAFAALHARKGGNADQPIGVPDLRQHGDMILRVR